MDKKKLLIGSAAAMTAAGTVAGVAALVGVRALRRRFQPEVDFRDAVVAITGGSRGLGFALALEFAQRGARIAICARDAETLSEAEHRLHARRSGFRLPVRHRSSRTGRSIR